MCLDVFEPENMHYHQSHFIDEQTEAQNRLSASLKPSVMGDGAMTLGQGCLKPRTHPSQPNTGGLLGKREHLHQEWKSLMLADCLNCGRQNSRSPTLPSRVHAHMTITPAAGNRTDFTPKLRLC